MKIKVEFYAILSIFSRSKLSCSDGGKESLKKSICPMMEFICNNGNATVYQWNTGTAPKEIRRENQAISADVGSNDVEVIYAFSSSIINILIFLFFPLCHNRA